MKHLVAIGSVVASAGAANAQFHELWDNNSYVRINITPGEPPNSRIGMDRWEVNGQNHLYSQWFWFRTDGMAREQRINDLPFIGATTTNTDFFDPRPDVFNGAWGSTNSFVIDVRFSLQGTLPGNQQSDIGEQIRITNFGPGRVFSFFQYCDFDLAGDINDDLVELVNPNAVVQADYLNNLLVAETVLTPSATLSEVGIYAATLIKLDDANFDNLDGTTGPLVGRRDYTWAFQWDFFLPSGSTFTISKDKHLVPAPGALALLGLGGLLAGRRRR
ncbi:MAG: hypothetical protein HBSAPP03_12860 [Phycisphaerae bacterium]|nr:MAG: hypothetical protein HBSAPP03_12860 [Phycisphaerae bacterium]